MVGDQRTGLGQNGGPTAQLAVDPQRQLPAADSPASHSAGPRLSKHAGLDAGVEVVKLSTATVAMSTAEIAQAVRRPAAAPVPASSEPNRAAPAPAGDRCGAGTGLRASGPGDRGQGRSRVRQAGRACEGERQGQWRRRRGHRAERTAACGP
jgi:hypothetical protein